MCRRSIALSAAAKPRAALWRVCAAGSEANLYLGLDALPIICMAPPLYPPRFSCPKTRLATGTYFSATPLPSQSYRQRETHTEVSLGKSWSSKHPLHAMSICSTTVILSRILTPRKQRPYYSRAVCRTRSSAIHWAASALSSCYGERRLRMVVYGALDRRDKRHIPGRHLSALELRH